MAPPRRAAYPRQHIVQFGQCETFGATILLVIVTPVCGGALSTLISIPQSREDTLMSHTDTPFKDNLNRDPLTGTAGSHPLGTGVGAALGDSDRDGR